MEFTSVQKIMNELASNHKVIPGNYDFTFKRLLSDEKTRDYISYMISEIVGLDFSYVKRNIKFRNTELLNQTIFEKRKMVDVILDINSLQIILEMNRNSGIWQNEKNFSYACKVYTDHMRRGDTYEDATPIILIDFNYQCGDNDKLISNYQLRIDNGNNVYTEKMKIYSVRIDKVKDISYSESTRLEKCFMMLVEADKDNLAFISRDDPMLENVKEVLESMSNEEDIIGVYDGELENWKEINSAFVHGMKEGKEEGIEQKEKEILQNMIKNHFDVQTISAVTGLNINRIQKMYDSYSKNTVVS